MNRGPALLHRVSLGLVGIASLVVAAAMILSRYSVQPVSGWVDRIDTVAVADAVGAGWFSAVIVAVALVALCWGWRLIRTTISPQRPDKLALAGSDAEGTLTVPLKQIAAAVEAGLTSQIMLRDLRVQAIDDRGSKIIRIIVQARPERSYDEIVAVLAPSINDLRDALEDSDVHVQALIHLDPVNT